MEVRECFAKEIYISKIEEYAKRMKKCIKEQLRICEKYEAEYVESPDNFKLGIAQNVKSGTVQLMGYECL